MSRGCTTRDHRLGASNSGPLLSHSLEAQVPNPGVGRAPPEALGDCPSCFFQPLVAFPGLWPHHSNPPPLSRGPPFSLFFCLLQGHLSQDLGPPDNPGGVQPESLKSVAPAKTLIPSKVTFVGVGGPVQPTTHAFSPYSLILVDTSSLSLLQTCELGKISSVPQVAPLPPHRT